MSWNAIARRASLLFSASYIASEWHPLPRRPEWPAERSSNQRCSAVIAPIASQAEKNTENRLASQPRKALQELGVDSKASPAFPAKDWHYGRRRHSPSAQQQPP